MVPHPQVTEAGLQKVEHLRLGTVNHKISG
jgi:hypothetical protein